MKHTAVPQTVLTVPLPPTHRIILHFLIPPLLHLTIFTFELTTSIAFSWCLIKEVKLPLYAGIIIFFAFLPSLATSVTIIACGSKDNGFIKKIVITILASLAFPIWALYRLSYRIFWAIEATMILHRPQKVPTSANDASREHKLGPRGAEVEEALDYSVEPSSAELYLFLRAFLFSLPNAFMNSIVIIAGLYDLDFGFETYQIEAASLIFSLIYLSMTAAYYQFFESQRLLGRNFPWREKPRKEEAKKEKWNDAAEEEQLSGGENEGKGPGDEVTGAKGTSEENSLSKEVEGSNQTDDEKVEKKGPKTPSSVQSSPPSSPSSPSVVLRHPPVLSDSAAQGTYRAFYLPVPNELAPRPPRTRPPRIPGGFRDIFCESVSTTTTSPRLSRAQSIRSTFFGWPPTFRASRRSVHSTHEHVLPHTPIQNIFPALPTRAVIKKTPIVYGLEHDDAIGLCVSYCHWFFLLVSRALALGTAFNYFAKPTAGLCVAHFLVVMVWLMRREGPPYFQPRKLALRCALAIISVSGILLELGTKPFGPKMQLFHGMLVFAEDFSLGLGWIFSGIYDSWWHSYTFYTCIGGHILSLSCALLYLFALRPRKHELPQEVKQEMPF